jgi:SSS family solute:Na+ symporter
MAGVIGLLTNIVAYGGMYLAGRYRIGPEIQFLNRMAICFGLCLAVMAGMTWARPLPEPIEFHRQTSIELHTSRGALIGGLFVVVLTVALYIIFSPLCLAR